MLTVPLFFLTARLGLLPGQVMSPTCLAADSNSTHYSDRIANVVVDNDATAQRLRTRLQLPQLSASNISLVTDSHNCGNASTALDAAQGVTNTSRTMYVFKLGNTRFAVVDIPPAQSTTDYSDASISIWVFDNKWNYLSALTT
jgi:hypothetical protein